MGHVLFDALATPEWRVIDARWERREIPTSVRARAQFDLVTPDLSAFHRLIDEQAVDPAFPALTRGLQRSGAEVRIASDGFDIYITRMLAAAGLSDLTVDSNRLDLRCARHRARVSPRKQGLRPLRHVQGSAGPAGKGAGAPGSLRRRRLLRPLCGHGGRT